MTAQHKFDHECRHRSHYGSAIMHRGLPSNKVVLKKFAVCTQKGDTSVIIDNLWIIPYMFKLFTSDYIHVSFFICSDLEMQEGAKILGKCNECIFFRKPPSLVPRWEKSVSTICNFCNL